MARRDIADIEPGMVLAADLTDSGGRVLLPRGVTLSEDHIRVVRQRGASSADIVEDGDAAGVADLAALDPALLARAEEYAAHFFRCSDLSHPAEAAIFGLAVARLARLLARGGELPVEPDLDPTAENMRDLFFRAEGTAADLVRHEVRLVSFPDIYFKIRQVLASPTSTARQISELVSKDTALSARLLKLVNSPFYGFAKKIDSIDRAVMVLGGNEISTLALGVSAMAVFKDIPPELITMRGFWEHSIACGVQAKVLGKAVGKMPSERLFISGMLHDIGRLIMFKKLPHASTEAIYYAKSNAMPLFEAERDVIGFDHALVGSLLLEEWKFPESLVANVRWHHAPSEVSESLEPAVIHLSDVLAVALCRTPRGSTMVPPLDHAAWERLGLEPEALIASAEEADREIEDIQAAFFPPGKS